MPPLSGEIQVLLINLSQAAVTIERGAHYRRSWLSHGLSGEI